MIDALGYDNLGIVSCRIPQMLVLFNCLYRPIIGEEKPENQNLAIIFTRGEIFQTIEDISIV